jgi:hypothetical protein
MRRAEKHRLKQQRHADWLARNVNVIGLARKIPATNTRSLKLLRDNWLSNRVFKSYDDLVDHCCAAWNKLVDQPWRIMSIGLRQWAHGF